MTSSLMIRVDFKEFHREEAPIHAVLKVPVATEHNPIISTEVRWLSAELFMSALLTYTYEIIY